MTIGDVLAIIALLVSLAATWIATMVATALAFPGLVEKARSQLLAAPRGCILRGVLVVVPALALMIGLLRIPGPVRIISYLLLTFLGVLGAVGCAAIARVLSERIERAGSAMPPFEAITRASILLVMSWFFPFFGWLIVLPVCLLTSAGAGFSAFRKVRNERSSQAAPAGNVGEPLSEDSPLLERVS